MLKIEHLTKRYGDKKAVDDLCFHILPGEIYGFIGHNGAGKTTTLKPAYDSFVGVRVSSGHLCRRQKHRPSRQARPTRGTFL